MNNKNKSKDHREEIEFRALVSKGHALLDREIIETFLSGAHDGVEASIIAERLMDRFKGIGRISSLEIDDLKTIEGVTDSTVTAILCLKEALKRVPREELKKGPVIGGNLEKLVEYLKACIGHLEKECTIIIYLDQKFHLIGETVYVGKMDSVPICIHEVARKAIIEKAKLMIMSHNHPCGSLKPSDEDLAVTKKLAEASEANMSNKIIVPFNDKEGNTYELNIDLNVLSKDNSISKAIVGIFKKNQRSIPAGDDLSKLPEILDAIAGKKNLLSAFSSKTTNKKAKNLESKKPSSQDGRDKPSNSEEGLNNHYSRQGRSRKSNPFISPLQKIEPSWDENEKLNRFKNAVIKAENINEVVEALKQAIGKGVRMNAYYDGQRSFADIVMCKILSNQFTKDEQKKIQTATKYSTADNERLQKLKEAGENAVQGGSVEEVEIDNDTFYMKFSGGRVEPAKVIEGTSNLGLNKGWIESGGYIIKIDNGEIEVRSEKGGARNYIDVSDNSDFQMTLHSSPGELKIRLCHDAKNYGQVQVIVEDKETWEKLQEEGGEIMENCLLGGKTIEKAIREGGFTRCGIWSEKRVTEEIKAVSKNETLSWVDRVHGGSKATSVER
ncbi:hypothetical protein NPIL_553281 [Nephila pilipes]|uniref:MPN domain-containing protein n=1 Tax=Nephila pilipes TaxID=299642 RepID=A0A8X6PVC3_NEPPI|nr:hypothetical protein NPIL_553281 [Nephila pilipes]